MKRELILLLTLALLILTVVAERASAVYARNLSAQQTKMSKKLEDLTVRTEGADVERQECGDIIALAEELESRINWQSDSTNVLRWFADTAASCNVSLVNSKLQEGAQAHDTVVFDTFARARYSLEVEGSYGALVQYLEKVEGSPLVMLTEKFTVNANTRDDGEGELKLTLSCLSPIESETSMAKGEAQ